MVRLAVRYLLARRKQTLLMLLGVFFGTLSFITLSGLLLGFKDYLVDQLVNNAAAVHIEPARAGGFIRDPGLWAHRLGSDPRVAAYSPQLIIPALFSRGGASVSGVLVGCLPPAQTRVTTIADYVTSGSFPALASGDRLALGAELEKNLGAGPSGRVTVSPPGGAPESFAVAAVFKTGVQQGDTRAYALLGDAQRIARAKGRINEIAVRLKDYKAAARIAREWSRLGPDRAESWDQKNASLVQTFKAEDLVRFLSLGAVLLVAGFGITNVLNMTVMQKRRDIAILRSMGYSSGDVLTLFLAQGLMLGAAGASLGCAGGAWLCLALRRVPFGGNPLGSGTGHLAVSLSPAVFVEAAVLALAATTLSSALPARSAAALSPIDIIRAGAE